MQNNQNSKFNIVYNNDHHYNSMNKHCKNNEIENMILSAAKLSKNSEVRVYFKNIPADEYTLGYKKFCGVKINDLVFYNPSLFDLYPKLIDFIYLKHPNDFINAISEKQINDIYFSNNKNQFEKSKPIINTNIYINLNISFDEIIKVLDTIVESIYNNKVLKILTVSSIKN